MKIFRLMLVAALMLSTLPAQATSFDCTRGRSLTERMICNDPALSKLDDTLGQLYWKARRQVINRRAFLTDSDSKWAWREANCRDAACLGTWYATRIEELQRLIESMRTGTADAPDAPGEADTRRKAVRPALQQTETAMLRCTAADPGIVVNDSCPTVIKANHNPWKYQPHGGDWFCGLAMLAPAETGSAQ
ncbi:lysozyme inhibitor LprI family protein [Paraburkholderia caffeinilytica]|uniref:lysozyme inhibitor LprI family protein n=1 Tax=Paraburkholderia caffeinilytica TaxID=1761016 RepID=UPI0038B781F2